MRGRAVFAASLARSSAAKRALRHPSTSAKDRKCTVLVLHVSLYGAMWVWTLRATIGLRTLGTDSIGICCRMRLYVVITDQGWFDFLSKLQPDELNFWQPSSSNTFRAIFLSEPLLFKLHSPHNFIVGGGFFSTCSTIPVPLAWGAFGPKTEQPPEARGELVGGSIGESGPTLRRMIRSGAYCLRALSSLVATNGFQYRTGVGRWSDGRGIRQRTRKARKFRSRSKTDCGLLQPLQM